MENITQQMVDFVDKTNYQDIPDNVEHTCKMFLLDCIGIALAGAGTDKGRFAVKLARRFGGPAESSLLGFGDRLSCSGAAFANGEMMQAMDYDPLIRPGHTGQCMVSAPLAVAECSGVSGKDLITAISLGMEFSTRLGRALSELFENVKEGPDKGMPELTPAHGYSSCVISGAAAIGKILKLDRQKLSYAIGIGGHIAPVPTVVKFVTTPPPAPMTKYGSAGWTAQAQVTAALLAEIGYTGDTQVLDGEFGFWRYYNSTKWEPEVMLKNIGQEWLFCERQLGHKPYPTCAGMQRALHLFITMIDRYSLMPDDIEKVNLWLRPPNTLPIGVNKDIKTHIDAQFSVPYNVAAAAYRVKVFQWQDLATMRDPRIIKFMEKVDVVLHPEWRKMGFRATPTVVEIVAKGKTYKETPPDIINGVPPTEARLSIHLMKEEALVEKFRNNASRILPEEKISHAIKYILELEKVENISELTKQLVV